MLNRPYFSFYIFYQKHVKSIIRKHTGNRGGREQRCRFSTYTGHGLLRELNPGPLAAEARIMPLAQAANDPFEMSDSLLILFLK